MNPAPRLTVEHVGAPALIQDAGRTGYMHQGVPPGGPLVRALFDAANQALDNPSNAAAIEHYGSLVLRADDDIQLADERGRIYGLSAGETWCFDTPTTRAGYVAVAGGGIDVPLVLGARATLLVAGLGGHEGRLLRPGDALRGRRLRVRKSPGQQQTCAPATPGSPVCVQPGPDLARLGAESWPRLLGTSFRISAHSDRVGTRLVGPPVASRCAASGASAPMVRGAIQLPPGGEPIVLGPDHPTTGGYPVVGVIRAASLDTFFSIPVGAMVTFSARR